MNVWDWAGKVLSNSSKRNIDYIGNHITISYDIAIGNNFNGSMT